MVTLRSQPRPPDSESALSQDPQVSLQHSETRQALPWVGFIRLDQTWPWWPRMCTYACSAGTRRSPSDSGYTAARWRGACTGTARPQGCRSGWWPQQGGTRKAVRPRGKGPPGIWQSSYRIQKLFGGCGNKNARWDPGRHAQKWSHLPLPARPPAVFWDRGSGV